MYEIRPESIKTYITDQSIKLPRFQRKQTWDDKKNFQLCISIFKEYPIGVCILSLDKKPNQPKWLLDGRQRRNALVSLHNDPENIYFWAQKFIGFKNNTQPKDLEHIFWEKINDYLEEPDDSNELEITNDNEIDIETESYDSSEQSVEDDCNKLSGLELLLAIIKLIHNRDKKYTGFSRPFDFSDIIENLPYLDKSSGQAKLVSKKIKSFVDEFKSHCINNQMSTNSIDSFKDFMFLRFLLDSSLRNKLNSKIDKNWDAISERIHILDRLDELLMSSKIGLIEVKGLSPVDSQKIFNIINTGGTQLTAVEISSAKPSWNVEIKNPSTRQSEETKKLYERIGVVSIDNVVKWDVPATLLNRLEGADILFKRLDSKSDEKSHEKNVTLGFKLLAGFFRNGVKREDIDDLSNKSKSEINWENDIEAFIADSNSMIKLISDSDYFKFFKSWKRPIVSLLSESIALNFFLILYKDFERKGKPTNSYDVKAKQFQKNAFILFDRLTYEYVLKEWRGSGDSKIANNLERADKGSDIFEPLEKEKWKDLLVQIMDNDKFSDSDNLTQKMLEPILFHFYCLNNMTAPDSQYGYEVDHILPQAIFKQSTLFNKESVQHNLYNLALLPKDENCSKSSKTLNMITSSWLKNQIVKYTFIPMDQFSHFSDLGNLDDLKSLRKPIFLNAFGIERQKILDN